MPTPSCSGLETLLAATGVGEAVGGDVVFVREPRAQVRAGANHREHAGVPGRGGDEHV